MKIFVTGGTGFIGCHFLNRALRAGHQVRALRLLSQPETRLPLVQQPDWVDVPMEELTVDHFRDCKVLVHLAAHSANVPYDTLDNCVRWNVQAPLKMFSVAAQAGISTFIVAGSCFEYGLSGQRYEFIPPDAPLEPTLSYPASKAAASVVFHAFACERKVRLLILRIFQVFGEGEPESRLWPSLRRAALAGEDLPMTAADQIRDFIPVEQVADAFINALSRTDLKPGEPRIENLGTGKPQTLREFAEHWWKFWGAKGKLRFGALPYRPNEVMRYVPEISSVGKPPAGKG
jgi:nucleoside-diphosphate-sugar epimerase